jgi:hypothetical protein
MPGKRLDISRRNPTLHLFSARVHLYKYVQRRFPLLVRNRLKKSSPEWKPYHELVLRETMGNDAAREWPKVTS